MYSKGIQKCSEQVEYADDSEQRGRTVTWLLQKDKTSKPRVEWSLYIETENVNVQFCYIVCDAKASILRKRKIPL